jgi:HD-GYP domain-containing protein (c-di-GMP phosphodiesterase class II)
MDQDRSWIIRTTDLKVGTIFSFDLTDRSGRVVLKSGQPFSEPIRKRLLAAGVDSVTIMVMPRGEDSSQLLLECYEAEAVQRLQANLAQTEQAFRSFMDELKQGNRAHTEGIRSQLDVFFVEAGRDTSAALGVLAARWNQELNENAASLMSRSARLSWISMVTGMVMGFSASDVVSMGLAGSLHDVSVLFHPEWLDEEFRQSNTRQFLADFQRHPIESAEILRQASGLSERILMNVTQVHEHMDGSGFPRGLRASQILPTARVLNVVDAYLEIVEPLFRMHGVVPADALAQICLHATQGVFDRDVTHALIEALSLYPIGTEVELSDSRRAVVVRSNPDNPLQPVVRLLDSSHAVTDLLQSNLKIQGPSLGGPSRRRRISKLEMQIPLWDVSSRHDIL